MVRAATVREARVRCCGGGARGCCAVLRCALPIIQHRNTALEVCCCAVVCDDGEGDDGEGGDGEGGDGEGSEDEDGDGDGGHGEGGDRDGDDDEGEGGDGEGGDGEVEMVSPSPSLSVRDASNLCNHHTVSNGGTETPAMRFCRLFSSLRRSSELRLAVRVPLGELHGLWAS